MTKEELIESLAYCGLLCGVCKNTEKGCKGCSNGGGPADCYQRTCCVEKGFDGCWQCESFPCDKGFFASDEWKGLCIGSVQCIKELGVEKFVDHVESKMGKVVEYGDFRFKNEEDIRTSLLDVEKT